MIIFVGGRAKTMRRRKSINEFDRTRQPKRSREGMQWGVLGESALLEGQCNAMDTQQPTAAVQNDGADMGF